MKQLLINLKITFLNFVVIYEIRLHKCNELRSYGFSLYLIIYYLLMKLYMIMSNIFAEGNIGNCLYKKKAVFYIFFILKSSCKKRVRAH